MPFFESVTGSRRWLGDKREYGLVKRGKVLGLVQTPSMMVQLDDGTYRAYVGRPALKEAVDPVTKANALGETLDALPLDVKYVGWQYLTQMGVTEEQQEGLFTRWRELPEATRTAYSAQWDAVDKTDAAALTAFVTAMITALS